MDLDTIALLAIALVYVVLVLLIHLIVDLFRVAVDPRLRAA